MNNPGISMPGDKKKRLILLARRILKSLSSNGAHTDVSAVDPKLSGRTYAIPFDEVWKAAVTVSRKRMRGWSVLYRDDRSGVIVAEALTLLLRSKDDIRISIQLDENGQTRVDLRATSQQKKRDWGRNFRRISKFLISLDNELAVSPEHILNQSWTNW